MASVSFRLPDQGASGTFNSGLRTEVVTTGPDGRASVWGMQWNKTPGTVQIHITAVKEQARTGIVSTQYLSDSVAPKAGGEGVFTASHNGHKWLWIAGSGGGRSGGWCVCACSDLRGRLLRPTRQPPASASAHPASWWGIRRNDQTHDQSMDCCSLLDAPDRLDATGDCTAATRICRGQRAYVAAGVWGGRQLHSRAGCRLGNILSEAFSGSFGLLKTDSSLAAFNSQGKLLASVDAAPGPALFAFSPGGTTALAYIASSNALVEWRGSAFVPVSVNI